jgi:SAM-dependent methyltransferase
MPEPLVGSVVGASMARERLMGLSTTERALASCGTSGDPIYRMVADVITSRGITGELFDFGCGTGALKRYLPELVTSYRGVDAVRYDGFPPDADFLEVDLDQLPWPLPETSADIAVAVETIEHLENPRSLVRSLVGATRPGGLVIVTTPNQLSLLSKLTLLTKGQFNAFQERPGLYPAHITALLEIDLIRIGQECGLREVRTHYSNSGRIPGSGRSWPRWLRGRAYSDNIAMSGIKPAS